MNRPVFSSQATGTKTEWGREPIAGAQLTVRLVARESHLAKPPAPLRILVVEDEVLIAEMVKAMLDELDCECLGPITDLELALAAARVDSYDAAILNLVIEGKNAYSVAAVVAERGLPFAFASGVPRSSIDPEWRDRYYLAKPYVMEDIRRWLESLRPPGDE